MADVSLSGRTLGEFTLRELIDEGGMGAVYRCEQPVLGREAVVKVLHSKLARDDTALARFNREARLAARLDHPFAAHVYAFGIEDDGLIWIAMELVHGVTLRQWLEDHGPMSLDQFVPFFERVCDVVHAAHERGIVHRDIKPGNIMIVERSGGRLMPKLLDFGLAKLRGEVELPAPAVDATDPETTSRIQRRNPALTIDSTTLGSPGYMAPEQWESRDVGPAADVYSLGVVAFEALTGRRPYRELNILALGKQHLHAEIPTTGHDLLDDVFQQALAKAPSARFATAVDLAEALRAADLVPQIRVAALAWDDHGRPDGMLWGGEVLAELERWIRRTGETAAGRELSTAEIDFVEASRRAAERQREETARRRWREWRLGVGVAILIGSAVFGIVIGHATYEQRIAEQRAADAEALAGATTRTAELEQGRAALLGGDYAGAQRHLGTAWQMGERSHSTQFMFDRAMQPLRAELARLDGHGRMWSASWSPDGALIATSDDHGAQIWDGSTYASLSPLPHGDTVYAAVWSGARELVTACGDGSVRIWDTGRGRLVKELRLHGETPRWRRVAVSGKHVAAVDIKGQLAAVWDAASGQVLTSIDLAGDGWPTIAFSNDGHWLAMSGGAAVLIVNTDRWQSTELPELPVHALAWAPDAPRLAVGTLGGDLSLWDAGDSKHPQHIRESGSAIDVLAWSQSGRIAAALRDGSALVFDVAASKLVSMGNHVHSRVASLEFSPDGAQLAVAASSGLVALSEAATGGAVTVFDAPKNAARSVRFSPDGTKIAGATWDGAAWIWSAAAPYKRWSAPAQAETCGLVGGVESDSRYLAVACVGHPTRVWDTSQDQLLAELPALEDGERVPYPVVVNDGTRAAIARGVVAEVYELPGGRLLRRVEHAAAVTAVAFRSAELISGSADGELRLEGRVIAAAGGLGIDAIVTLPTGGIAAADTSGRVRVFGAGGAAVGEYRAGVRARMLRPSGEGKQVLVVPYYAGKASPMVLIALDIGSVAMLDAPQVYAARWIGDKILSAHEDGTARIWSDAGRLIRVLVGDRGFLVDAALMLDGSTVVGGSGNGTLCFWNIETGLPMWAASVPGTRIFGVSVGPWGIIARGLGGEMSRWVIPDSAAGTRNISDALPFSGGMLDVH